MNAVTKALSEVYFSIPREILEIVFKEKSKMLNKNISLDEMIMSRIIRPKILVDCNLVGGINSDIYLDKCKISFLNNSESLIDVPKTATNNKTIISVLSLLEFSNTMTMNQTYASSATASASLDVGRRMMDNLAGPVFVQTSRLELIGENKVLVQDPSMIVTNGALRVVLENDNNMGNISPRSYITFSELVVLGVKAYIYNFMIVKLNQGYIYNGHELGVVKDIIEGYADSNEMYKDFLENTWTKVAFMNNSNSMDGYIVSMLGNMI